MNSYFRSLEYKRIFKTWMPSSKWGVRDLRLKKFALPCKHLESTLTTIKSLSDSHICKHLQKIWERTTIEYRCLWKLWSLCSNSIPEIFSDERSQSTRESFWFGDNCKQDGRKRRRGSWRYLVICEGIVGLLVRRSWMIALLIIF